MQSENSISKSRLFHCDVIPKPYKNPDRNPFLITYKVIMMFNQVGRGQKRNHESDSESENEDEQGQRYFERDPKIQYHSDKFGMTATDHRVRFNNVIAHRDLLESIDATQKIFHYLLDEVTEGMNPNDQVRFILRSEQLDTPISLPFMPLEQLTTEKVYAQIEKVVQSNQDFRLNDTVTIDINHVAMPEGSGSSKRTLPDIRDHLKSKGSVVCINNFDDLCLATGACGRHCKHRERPKVRPD